MSNRDSTFPNLTLFVIQYVLPGCGREAAQNVLASTFEIAMEIFKEKQPDALMTRVDVGERTIMYGDMYEDEDEGS